MDRRSCGGVVKSGGHRIRRNGQEHPEKTQEKAMQDEGGEEVVVVSG